MKSMQDFHVILAFSTPTGIEEMLYPEFYVKQFPWSKYLQRSFVFCATFDINKDFGNLEFCHHCKLVLNYLVYFYFQVITNSSTL